MPINESVTIKHGKIYINNRKGVVMSNKKLGSKLSAWASSSGEKDNHISLSALIGNHELLVIKDDMREIDYCFEVNEKGHLKLTIENAFGETL